MSDYLSEKLTAFFEPLQQTLVALADVLVLAQAGTTLFGLFLFIAALELLRSSEGALTHFARFMAVAAATIVGTSLIFGDFLASPAKAAYILIAARMPAAHDDTAVFATLGLATAGLAYGMAKKSGSARMTERTGRSAARPRRSYRREAESQARVFGLAGALKLDAAARIQMHQFSNRPLRAPAKAARGPAIHARAMQSLGARRARG
jgi:hypothetical protein